MTREDFVLFLREFKLDFDTNKGHWEHENLSDFLGAMISYTEDIQGYYDNMEMKIDANEPSWERFSHILKGARIYE